MLEAYLEKDNLIICNLDNKNNIIEEINNYTKLYSYKIMDLNEFNKNYFFDYNKNTIYYLMKNYNLTCDIAYEYIDSMYYIKDILYKSRKLNRLKDIKKELIYNNLLTQNKFFKNYLNRVNIIVIDVDLNDFYKEIFDGLNAKYIKDEYPFKSVDLYYFDEISSEVSYVVRDIYKKINNGIDINNIKIVCPDDYFYTLNNICSYTNLKLNYKKNISLYNLTDTKYVLDCIDKNISFNEIIDNINDSEYKDKLINIFNNYIGFNIDYIYLKKLIINDLKNTFKKEDKYTNSIDLIKFSELDDNNYNYILAFNKDNYPKVYKDSSFLSDSENIELKLFTSFDKNKLEKNNILNRLYGLNNTFISVSKNSNLKQYELSSITDKFNIIKDNKIEYDFSEKYNISKLVSLIDEYYKFGVVSSDLDFLLKYYNIDYNSYDNKFSGIDKDLFLNSFNNLTLSYTSINNYFKCSFKFYVSNILKIKDNFNEFYKNIGTIFHNILKIYRNDNFNLDECFSKEIEKYEFSIDEKVLLNKLKEELKYDIEKIKYQESLYNFDKYLFENEFNIKIDNKYNKNVTFKGFVDKIIYKENESKKLVSIIDYKTGSEDISLEYIEHGINMQLPIYMYLIKNDYKFKDSIIVGLYLQKIINKDLKYDPLKSIDELKYDLLKLNGYSNSDYIDYFDKTYTNSKLIKSLKVKKDESFSKNSKVLSNNELLDIYNLVNKKINSATSDILDNKFDINPKRINDKDIGCLNCRFNDICFKNNKDFININSSVEEDTYE